MFFTWQNQPPRWLTRTHRLFPHPLFAAVISFFMSLIAFIFLMVGLHVAWPAFLVSVLFAAGTFATLASAIVQIQIRRESRSRDVEQQFEFPTTQSSPTIVPSEPSVESHGAPTLTIAISMTAYLTLFLLVIQQVRQFRNPAVAQDLKFGITMALCLVSNLYMRLRGQAIITEFFARRGKAPIVLTTAQCILVVIMIISFSLFFVWMLA